MRQISLRKLQRDICLSHEYISVKVRGEKRRIFEGKSEKGYISEIFVLNLSINALSLFKV